MKYVDEFRNKALVQDLAHRIREISRHPVSLMEVCGGHTLAIRKFGIPSLLPETVELLSGPGCPVCVTSREYIDRAVAYSRLNNVIIATYGDLIRVPGSSSSLEKERAAGADVRIVYSTLDALKMAEDNPSKKIIFLGIGFETTTPSSAVAIKTASQKRIANFFVYSAHKTMPPAMSALIDEGIKIDGYIGPGHVSTVAGADMYNQLAKKYNLAIVIAGFEPVDLLQSIYLLVRQFETGNHHVEVQYKRVVKPQGNLIARKLVNEIFEPRDDWWRGLGILKNSGLGIRKDFAAFDAEKNIEVETEPVREPKGCICGEVLKGIKKPYQCKLFANGCNPEDPVGACMVSSEGACHAYFRYQVYE